MVFASRKFPIKTDKIGLSLTLEGSFDAIYRLLNGESVSNFKFNITDNDSSALDITEGTNSYLKFVTTNSGEKITLGKKLEAGSVEIEGSNFDINGGNIDGATIATSDITVGAGKTLDVSAGTLTLADNQISGDKVEGGTIASTTITALTTTTTKVDHLQESTAAHSIVLDNNWTAASRTCADLGTVTTADINGGTVDGITSLTAGGDLDIGNYDLRAADLTADGELYCDHINELTGSHTIVADHKITANGDIAVDHLLEITSAHGVNCDGVTLKDGGALVITGGTNTFNLANGTGSLDVAAGKTVNIDDDVTVSAELHVETATHVNQDLTTDAGPSFDHVHTTVTTGTAPFVVASTTVSTNLNADLADGFHHTYLSGNLDNDSSTNIAHGLTLANIRSVSLMVYNGSAWCPAGCIGLGWKLDATNIVTTNGAAFNAQPYRVIIHSV